MLADRGVLFLHGEWTLAILGTEPDLGWAFVRLLAAGVEHFQLLLLGLNIDSEVRKSVLRDHKALASGAALPGSSTGLGT